MNRLKSDSQLQNHQEIPGWREKEKAADSRQCQTTDEDRENLIPKLEKTISELQEEISNRDGLIDKMEEIAAQRQQKIQWLENRYAEISGSFFWKITGPARSILDSMKALIRKHAKIHLLLRAGKKMFTKGPGEATALWRSEKEWIDDAGPFISLVPAEIIRQQKADTFDKTIRFSILVPLCNTPRKHLVDMIQSVRRQTYGNWELCLSDGSDSSHPYVRKICEKAAKKDPRIRYDKLNENGDINENMNACLRLSSGNFIGLLDHDDLLHPCALYEYAKEIRHSDADFLYSDEASFENTPEEAFNDHYKPDFAPDTLRSYNYICHFVAFSRVLMERAGGLLKKEYDGSQDYDMVLRLTEKADHIAHIPKILYYRRAYKDFFSYGVENKLHIIKASHRALAAHLERSGLRGAIRDSRIPFTYRIDYEIEGNPLVSIIIANKDHVEDLSKCIRSILEKTTWKNWEVIVVENNSTDPETFRYYKEIEKDSRIRVVKWERGFNYSAINNFGAGFAKGDQFLLLNNDTEIITPDWLEQMLMFAQRKDVGAVGVMLYYPDDTVQHAGVIVGLGGSAAHSHKHFKRGDPGYACRLTVVQDLSAVTAACIMIPRNVWEEVNGLDEGYQVAFNDVDLCLRIREAGYLVVWTPYAELYHYESKSRGYDDTPEKEKRINSEKARFRRRWSGTILATGDPYYNPNLTQQREDFSLRNDGE